VAEQLGDRGLVNDLLKEGAQRPKPATIPWHVLLLRNLVKNKFQVGQ